jgi:hypothetical protein
MLTTHEKAQRSMAAAKAAAAAAKAVVMSSYVKAELKDDIKDAMAAQPGDPEFDAKEHLWIWLKGSRRDYYNGPNGGWPSFCNKPIEEWDAVFVKYFTEDGLRAAKERYEDFLRKNLIDWLLEVDIDRVGPTRGWPSFCNKPIEEWDDWLVMKRFKEDRLQAAKAAYDKYNNLTGGKRRKRTKFNKRKSSSRVLSKSRRRTHRK